MEVLEDFEEITLKDNFKGKIKWIQNINFTLNDLISVKGFVALRKNPSIEDSGFCLFRRNRLILGTYQNLYKPKEIFGLPNSIQYSRIFGEIHLDGIDVSHTKDSFNFGNIEDQFIQKLKEELNIEPNSMYRQACNYKIKEFDDLFLKPILDKTDQIIQKLNNEIQDCLKSISLKKKFKIIKNKKSNIKIINNKEYFKDFKFSSNLLKFFINNNLVEINYGIGEVEDNKLFQIFNYKKTNYKESKLNNFYVVFNKNHKLFIEITNERRDSIFMFLSILFSVSLSEIILYILNNFYLAKDRFISKSILNLILE